MTMRLNELKEQLEELASAEDFLVFFGIAFEARVVQVNRLHILQRFHHYLAEHEPPEAAAPFDHYGACLQRAYNDFVGSSAQAQKALKVFQRPDPGFVSLDEFHY